jgi:exodeoxyribonuclease III
MIIATWNVNSVKARIETITNWLKEASPDIALFQETKCEDDAFPRFEFEALGYNLALHGQKSYNGTAVLSKLPIDEQRPKLPGGDGDDHARYLETVVSTSRGALRVASIYLPNGNPVKSDRFAYKLDWMDRLIAHARGLLDLEEAIVLAGDYNVIPGPEDARFPENWTRDALFQPETRLKYRELVNLGFTDAVRAAAGDGGLYTFWDYQAGAWQRNNGIRIDHALLSPQAADRYRGFRIDKHVRGWEKPSDHVPVLIDLDL